MSKVRLGLRTVMGTRHLICDVLVCGPEIEICWPDKTDPQPYKLALTPEEVHSLRGLLAEAEKKARKIRIGNDREMQTKRRTR